MEDFLNFALAVVKIGGVGLGALVFVMAFIILLRNQSAADDGIKAFRTRFLTLGFSFAVLSLAAWLAQPVIERAFPASAGKRPHRVTIDVSPDLEVQKLPPLVMRLDPANAPITAGKTFELNENAVINIKTDRLIEEARALRQTAEKVVASNRELLNAQADLVSRIDPAEPERREIIGNVAAAQEANKDVAASLETGQFKESLVASARVQRATTDFRRAVVPR